MKVVYWGIGFPNLICADTRPIWPTGSILRTIDGTLLGSRGSLGFQSYFLRVIETCG